MLSRLKALFRGRSVTIQGVGKLEEGMSKKVAVGDPLAGGTSFVLCRVNGELFALDDHCPHEDGRIQDGPLADGRFAVCPLHGYKFDPRTGQAHEVSCRKARTYRVEQRGDDCEVWY